MRWYWWLLIGLVIGAGGVFLLPMLINKKGNPDSLARAREVKAEKKLEKDAAENSEATL